MKRELWLIAWRNILRNRRRSALTVTSIAVGLAAVLFGQSLLRSFQRQMIEKATGVMLGHVQIQASGVADRKIPERLLKDPERHRRALAADPRIAAAGTRLLFTGLVYAAGGSRGVMIVGVDPRWEGEVSILPGYLREGRYFGGSPRDLVLGAKLAGELDARLGERIVVMGQSSTGEMNSELFRVAGTYHTGSVAYDGQIVYIPLAAAQRIRGRADQASHVVAKLKDVRRIPGFVAERGREFAALGGELLSYEQTGAEIAGIKAFQDAILVVMLTVIFSIVGLGILNTISMSFFERIREFGVLRALGARRKVVFQVLLTEAALMGALGIACGLALGLVLIWYFGAAGLRLPLSKAMAYFIPFDDVIYMRPEWTMHLWSAAGLFVICVSATLGPAVRASRIVIVKALQHI